jgi:exodeoxyribonuclease VII large subunit
MRFALETRAQRLDSLAARLQSPADRLAANSARIGTARARLGAALALSTRNAERRLSHALHRLAVAMPNLDVLRQRIGQMDHALRRATPRRLAALGEDVARLSLGLAHLDPAAVLERGYAIARMSDGSVVRTSAVLRTGDPLEISFGKGAASVRVEKPH